LELSRNDSNEKIVIANTSMPRQKPMSQFGKPLARIGMLLVLGATYFLYAPVTAFSFVYDDIFQIVQNPRIDSWSLLPAYFTQHFWAHVPGTPANLYRPLVLVWFLINNSIFFHEPFGWHLTTLLVHLLVTGMVFVLARMLLNNLTAAIAVAALFAVHPIHVESVAWISAVTEPLCAAWFLAAFTFYLNYREGKAPRAWLLASLGCYAASLLTKETAVAFPILLAAYEAFHRTLLGKSARRIWPYFLVLGTYLGLRSQILHGLGHRVSTVSQRDAFLTLPWVIWFYIRRSIWPGGMSPLYDVTYVHSIFSFRFLLPALLLIGMTIAIGWASWRYKLNKLAFAAIWFGLTLAPAFAAFVAAPKYEGISDRYLYLPSVAICLLAGLAINNAGSRPWIQKSVYAGVCLAVLAGSIAVRDQIHVWENNYSLFERAVEIAPRNVTAAINLGVELQRRRRYQEALTLAQNSLQREPDSANLLAIAGAAAFQLHRFDLSEHYYEDATRYHPSRSDFYQCLAMTQIQLERYADAATSLKEGIVLSPERPGLHYTLGKILSWNNDWASARDQFSMEMALDPQNSAVTAAFEQAQRHLPPAAVKRP
jgi:tetratricopeptide (TPR) repeat protein